MRPAGFLLALQLQAFVLSVSVVLDQPVLAQSSGYPSITKLKGSATAYAINDGGAEATLVQPGPIGIKSISMGKHFFVQDLVSTKRFSPPYHAAPNLSEWQSWYGSLLVTLDTKWHGAARGQAQVVVILNNDGKIEEINFIGFCPGLDATGIGTSADQRAFQREVIECLRKVESIGRFRLPGFGVARKVAIGLLFGADGDVILDFPDISLMEGLPWSEKNLRIFRTFVLLNNVGFNEAAEAALKFLPPIFIDKELKEMKVDSWSSTFSSFGGLRQCATASVRDKGAEVASKCEPFVSAVVRGYLTKRRFAECEQFAQQVVGGLFPSPKPASLLQLCAQYLQKNGEGDLANSARQKASVLQPRSPW